MAGRYSAEERGLSPDSLQSEVISQMYLLDTGPELKMLKAKNVVVQRGV
jgi:hypothetical protein